MSILFHFWGAYLSKIAQKTKTFSMIISQCLLILTLYFFGLLLSCYLSQFFIFLSNSSKIFQSKSRVKGRSLDIICRSITKLFSISNNIFPCHTRKPLEPKNTNINKREQITFQIKCQLIFFFNYCLFTWQIGETYNASD